MRFKKTLGAYKIFGKHKKHPHFTVTICFQNIYIIL